MTEFIDKHFVPLLWAASVLAFVVLALALLLFWKFLTDYERTRKAMTRVIQSITGLRKAAKGDATADDDLAATISKPMKAVKPLVEKEPEL